MVGKQIDCRAIAPEYLLRSRLSTKHPLIKNLGCIATFKNRYVCSLLDLSSFDGVSLAGPIDLTHISHVVGAMR
jgi:hypothetical protein